MNARVVSARCDHRGWTLQLADGQTVSGGVVFSSMPLSALIEALEPQPPRHIRAVAARLRHRGLITVAVALRRRYDIPYNWVYTPGADCRVGRIQNYTRWSPDLAPQDFAGTHLGFEYYYDADSDLRGASDQKLLKLVERDLEVLGCADSPVEHVMISRSPYAYPVHNATRDRSVGQIREYLRRHYPLLYPVGRNGMHRYDNQDHAMASALQSVALYFGANVDPWQVNTDTLYHESDLTKG
ncbi:MAG: hypothetical protein SW019_26455 [Actinomycetota bacterium]|nr:hypothetical protein [Actinomycetota bacterium]